MRDLSGPHGTDAWERIVYARGVLEILRDTRLFGPLVDEAIEGLDEVLDRGGLGAGEDKIADLRMR
jgi:hypothetical protein